MKFVWSALVSYIVAAPANTQYVSCSLSSHGFALISIQSLIKNQKQIPFMCFQMGYIRYMKSAYSEWWIVARARDIWPQTAYLHL